MAYSYFISAESFNQKRGKFNTSTDSSCIFIATIKLSQFEGICTQTIYFNDDIIT